MLYAIYSTLCILLHTGIILKMNKDCTWYY